MKYYIVVGEASGDLHASNLMKEIYALDESADIRFWGGDLMKAVGGELVVHYKERAFMGFTEIISHLPKLIKLISFCKEDITEFNPDVVIFIDNSGFNLRIAKWAKQQGFRTSYYIAPQVWASRPGRVKAIKRDVDDLFVILPFEQDFYKKYDYKVNFAGHPLIDAIQKNELTNPEKFKEEYHLGSRPIIALLPGSRKHEIKNMLPVMLDLVNEYKNYQFIIAGAPSQTKEFYKLFYKDLDIKLITNATYDILNVSYAAIVTSGTATLETALYKVPQVVCYKTSWLSYIIAKSIITLKYISLVNLILNREVVTELIQEKFNKKNLKIELDKILEDNYRQNLLKSYRELELKLGGGGASKKVATYIFNKLF